jgi:hypothetical protein
LDDLNKIISGEISLSNKNDVIALNMIQLEEEEEKDNDIGERDSRFL